jgi:hypothetical protein
MAKTKTGVKPKATERVVWLNGSGSGLMHGDPDVERYKNRALPMLLAEGWTVKATLAAHVILTGGTVPPPEEVEEDGGVTARSIG